MTASPKRPTVLQDDDDVDAIGYATAAGYGAVPSTASATPAVPVFVVPPPLYSNDDVPDDFKYGVSVANAEVSIRLAFVRKVYTILACQLGATGLLSALFMFNDGIKSWVQTNPWALFTSMIATFLTLFILIAKRRSHPSNLYLLGLFTLFEAYAIATIVTFYDSVVVLQAVILTFALFVGLTLFSLQTKYDFSSWGPFLVGSLWVIIIAGFLQFFFPFGSGMQFAIAVVTAILFCAFICYDTQEIFSGLSPEEYIVAAIELYLDVLNLFLAILRILDNRDS